MNRTDPNGARAKTANGKQNHDQDRAKDTTKVDDFTDAN